MDINMDKKSCFNTISFWGEFTILRKKLASVLILWNQTPTLESHQDDPYIITDEYIFSIHNKLFVNLALKFIN